MKLLTPKQKVVLQAIKKFFAENGKMPTIRELKQETAKLGLKFKSLRSVFLYLNALEEKGFIKRSSRDKGIEVIDHAKKNFITVPVLGMANAGRPTFFAEQNVEGYLKISKKLIKSKDIFAISVSGDSMNLSKIHGKKIRENDFILVDPRVKNFNNGDKVLTVIDGLATVKVFKKIDNQMIGLFPESTNKKHQPIYLTPSDDFIINGKVIDVLNG
ncbi:transcriptional repressor LexA [Patescibacteria group bacterium AH-259-L07]|nr:transcriptional repressor LexA [Patescibacteria group bacterium AH-259-L07]